jgi:hypothetical protein
MSSAEPISSASASETSLTTSSERALLWRKLVPARLLFSLSAELGSVREGVEYSSARVPRSLFDCVVGFGYKI